MLSLMMIVMSLMICLTSCNRHTTILIMPSENVIRKIPDSIRVTFPDSLKHCEWCMSDSRLMELYEKIRKYKAEIENCKK